MTEPTINLFHGDCMPAMKGMRDKQYDLAIVDPPYGIGEFLRESNSGSYKKATRRIRHNYKDYSVGWNDYTPTEGYFFELERISKRRIIWGANYYNCFENGGALVWYKNPGFESQMSQCEIASLSWKKQVDYIYIRKHNGFIGPEYIHPCEKPIKLYKHQLNKYAKPGDKILDTHGGSMSIAIACYDMGFDLDLWEIDEDYYKAGVKRFNDHKKQLKLFRA